MQFLPGYLAAWLPGCRGCLAAWLPSLQQRLVVCGPGVSGVCRDETLLSSSLWNAVGTLTEVLLDPRRLFKGPDVRAEGKGGGFIDFDVKPYPFDSVPLTCHYLSIPQSRCMLSELGPKSTARCI